jgi:AAA domain
VHPLPPHRSHRFAVIFDYQRIDRFRQARRKRRGNAVGRVPGAPYPTPLIIEDGVPGTPTSLQCLCYRWIATGIVRGYWETTRRLRPKLLLLDPLVRLQGIDENSAGEVAELPAYFRSLQRELDLSVVLVHHTRKNAAGGVAAGQGLRGSSDIHAFGDSNLYLRRTREHLVLSSDHRAARAAASVYLELVATDAQTTHLEVIGELRDGSAKRTMDGKHRSLEQRCWTFWARARP